MQSPWKIFRTKPRSSQLSAAYQSENGGVGGAAKLMNMDHAFLYQVSAERFARGGG